MTCDIDTFKLRFPEIDSLVVDARFSVALSESACYYTPNCLSEGCTDNALCQLVAHLIVIDDNSSTAPLKGISSQSVDGVSVSYDGAISTSTGADPFFNSTKYGNRFLKMIEGCGYGAIFV